MRPSCDIVLHVRASLVDVSAGFHLDLPLTSKLI